MDREEGKQYVLSISYGKDSLACLGAIEKLNLPLDRIVHAEIYATKDIPADCPEIIEFKKKADKIIKNRWGITVEHIRAKSIDGEKNDNGVSFEDGFYHQVKTADGQIHIKGFPMQLHPWCKKLKIKAIEEINQELGRSNTIHYIGIAIDEQERLDRLNGVTQLSPLALIGWTEKDAYDWCVQNDLLSPTYKTANRTGCWFCNSQPLQQLREIYTNYPQLWNKLLEWDNDSPVKFKAEGYTVHDYDKRFKFENDGKVPEGKAFRWKMIREE